MHLRQSFMMRNSGPAKFIATLTESKLGCLMAKIPQSDAFKILRFSEQNIPESELADDGREREVHVTVAYGFLPEVTPSDFPRIKPVKFELGKISLFEPSPSRQSYVVKVEVISSDLKSLHYHLRDCFGDRLQVTFDDYKPHLTLAYCKPGASCVKSLDGSAYFDGMKFECSDFIFSRHDRSAKVRVGV